MTLSIALIALVFTMVFTAIPVAKAVPDFEQYGPHVNQILIKLYANENLEFAAFEAGEIDVVDWPLSKYWIDRWTTDPEIDMADYGGELGAYEFDLNLNETMRAAGPTGAIDGTSELSINVEFPEFRHALDHLVDRAYIVSTIREGFAVPLYGMIPPAMGGWVNPSVVEMHPYDPTLAASILAGAGIVDSDSNGYLNWPAGMEGGKDIELDFCIRDDHTPGRKEAGDRLLWELTVNLPGPKFKVNRWSAIGSVGARKWWMDGKCADIYTGGWSLTRDPDYLYGIWHSSMYWHPGRPPNSGNIHDPEFDAYAEGVYFAQNFADAKVNCWEAQRVVAEKSLWIGMYANSAPEARRVHYTGGTDGVPASPDDGENMYRGDDWVGFANGAGFGYNVGQSFFNVHPEGHELPASSTNPMIVRYGFKVAEVNALNPVYAEWVWDWEIMGKCYDSFFAVNPYDLSEDIENMADRWQTLVWDNAGSPATELVFELRNDIYFHDGVQLTAEDVYFTFVELVQACEARELPYPWYYSNLADVNTVVVESPFKVRVRVNSLSVFALHWIGGNIVLPKHIWGPMMMGPDMIIGTADDDTYDPETFAPDPQLIGSGPFKAYPHSIDKTDYYIPNSYAKLDAYTGYWSVTPDRETGGVAQVAYSTPDTLSVWELNYHRTAINLEGYIVTGDGLGNYRWWNYATSTWVAGSAPTLPPDPPVGVTAETNPIPAMTGTNPGVLLGNVPGILVKTLPVPTGFAVKSVTVLTRSTPYGWRQYSMQKTQPTTAKEGDINDDSVVDITDATLMSVQFGLRAWIWTEIDINMDNVINLADASIVIRDFNI